MEENKEEKKKSSGGAIGAGAAVAAAGLLMGWAAVESACKPLMKTGRSAIRGSLDPSHDADDAHAAADAPPKQSK